jgi:hypothetical protein
MAAVLAPSFKIELLNECPLSKDCISIPLHITFTKMFPGWHSRFLTIPKAVVRRESRHMSTLLEQIPFWQNGLFLVLMIHTRKCLWSPAPTMYTRSCKIRVLQREGNEQQLIENKDIYSSTESPGEEFGNLFARRLVQWKDTVC